MKLSQVQIMGGGGLVDLRISIAPPPPKKNEWLVHHTSTYISLSFSPLKCQTLFANILIRIYHENYCVLQLLIHFIAYYIHMYRIFTHIVNKILFINACNMMSDDIGLMWGKFLEGGQSVAKLKIYKVKWHYCHLS